MLRLHRDKKELGVVADQVGCPSSTLNLARACWRVISGSQEGIELPPVLHWCDGGAASWYDVSVAVGELAMELGLLNQAAKVNPISTTDYPTPATRPGYSLAGLSGQPGGTEARGPALASGAQGCPAGHSHQFLIAMTNSMPTAAELLGSRRRVLVTGGAGFIGGAVVRRLLRESEAIVFNLDKMGYASDLTSIEEVLSELGDESEQRHVLQQVNLADANAVRHAVKAADPDLVMHLAAESHVDRSIASPGVFIESNVTGTYNLLQAVRSMLTV